MKQIVFRLALLLGLAGIAAGAYYFVAGRMPTGREERALAVVKRGDLEVKTYLRGTLQAVRSTTLIAPNLGSTSQITSLASAGALARPKDLIAEFDDSDRRVFLEDALLDLAKTEQDLKKAEIELKILRAKDQVELLSAKFAVRRAALDVRQNELISAIDARKNELTLEESKRRLEKLESDIQSRLQEREAELAVLREQIKKAELEVSRERRRIENAKVLTPLGGLVSILNNRSGGRSFGQSSPPVQEGDQIPPGMAIVQLLDLSEMDLMTKAEEVERASLKVGQEAVIYLDALPGKAIRGTVKRVGRTASMNFFRGEATKKFECVLSVDMGELLMHVGASPEQIERILATAKENRAAEVARRFRGRAPAADPARSADPGGGPSRRGGSGQAAGQASGAASPAGRSGAGTGGARENSATGNRRRGSGGDRERFRKLMQERAGGRDMESLSQEERRKLFQQVRAQMGGGGSAGSRRGGERGGQGAARGAAGGGQGQSQEALFLPTASQQFSAEERANARLPASAREGSDVEVLLRPGLLADAEVIIDRIPNALHIPVQAVFEGRTGSVVYVPNGKRLEARKVELGKRTESRVEILSGLEEGEIISLERPADQQGGRKTKKKKGAETSASPGAGFPGSGGPGAGSSGRGGRGGAGGGGRSRGGGRTR